MTTNEQIGARLRAQREKANLSQDALGKALGVTYQQVAKLEKGRSGMSAVQVVKAAAALGCLSTDILQSEAKR